MRSRAVVVHLLDISTSVIKPPVVLVADTRRIALRFSDIVHAFLIYLAEPSGFISVSFGPSGSMTRRQKLQYLVVQLLQDLHTRPDLVQFRLVSGNLPWTVTEHPS